MAYKSHLQVPIGSIDGDCKSSTPLRFETIETRKRERGAQD